MARNSVSIKVNDREVQKVFAQLEKKMPKQIDRAVEASAVLFKDLLVNDILDRTGSGEAILVKQKEGAAGSLHRPSVEGEPPAPITSVYRSSWRREKVRDAVQRVSTGDRRGPWLEYGTRTMGERPHVRPAVKKHKKVHVSTIRKAIQSLI